jgi:glycosyltransferase involved in cell wall biosynthesis
LVLTTQKETSTVTRVLSGVVKVHVVDPSAYTPAYDHALCAALARAGVEVELVTSAFPYAAVPPAAGYVRRELFYRSAGGGAGSTLRRARKLASHVPDMLRYRVASAGADLVHFQWFTVPQLDVALLPRRRPLVVTAHDIVPPAASPGERAALGRIYRRAQAVIAHSAHGAQRLVGELGVPAEHVHVIAHGAFEHLAATAPAPLPRELPDAPPGTTVVLCFGLLRPNKGLDVLLDAWPAQTDAQLWIVGRPRFDVAALRARAPASVHWVARYVSDGELAACFRRADLVVLPYRTIEQSGVLATALAFGSPLLVSDAGGLREVAAAGAAASVPAGDATALRERLEALIADPQARERLAAGARALAAGAWSWDAIAARTRELYEELLS